MRKQFTLFFLTAFLCMLFFLILSPSVMAEENKSVYDKRMALYKKTEALTQLPWYYIAAIDQYERQIDKDAKDDQLVSIRIPEEVWFGPGNVTSIQNEKFISLFGGKGKDGNGDFKADPHSPDDVLYTAAMMVASYGPTEDDIKIGLWHFYKRALAVQTIKQTAKVFKTFKDIHLTKRDFPVAIEYNYSYRSTWGDRRGFGGLRIHEGTDIFAGYQTPVKSTTYGVVEMKGWNTYGGWRIGIRDIFNIYHYYAHLGSFAKDVKTGMVVKPGDIIGYVGSTGYGPPGTSGKFPPHLHYGMYKDNGKNEWSFDPYPYLRKWERMAKEK